ncbi:hypothetical protein B0H11DRAFT_863445 [Mycena galericulata]|nr:hypothetical protein B0H11DRAFT_863445 [Mycena galericulata]
MSMSVDYRDEPRFRPHIRLCVLRNRTPDAVFPSIADAQVRVCGHVSPPSPRSPSIHSLHRPVSSARVRMCLRRRRPRLPLTLNQRRALKGRRVVVEGWVDRLPPPPSPSPLALKGGGVWGERGGGGKSRARSHTPSAARSCESCEREPGTRVIRSSMRSRRKRRASASSISSRSKPGFSAAAAVRRPMMVWIRDTYSSRSFQASASASLGTRSGYRAARHPPVVITPPRRSRCRSTTAMSRVSALISAYAFSATAPRTLCSPASQTHRCGYAGMSPRPRPDPHLSTQTIDPSLKRVCGCAAAAAALVVFLLL